MIEKRLYSHNIQGFQQEIEDFLEKNFETLRKRMIKKWFSFKDHGVKDSYSDGSEINYTGVAYEGQPTITFWSKEYWPVYLDNIISDATKLTLEHCKKHEVWPNRYLNILEKLCPKYIAKLYEEMAKIDATLRGRGTPEKRIDVGDYIKKHQMQVSGRIQNHKLTFPQNIAWVVRKLFEFFKDIVPLYKG